MEHTHSINAQQVGVHSESVGNKERSVTQSEWNLQKVMKHMDEQGLMIQQQPMTPDEAFRVSDDEVYYYIS